MKPILNIDPVSLLATCSVTGTVGQLAKALASEGYVATLPSGKTSLEQALLHMELVALTLQTRTGIVQTKCVPRTAAGPDFKRIFLQMGVGYPTEVVIRIRRKPEVQKKLVFQFFNPLPFLTSLKASGVAPREIKVEPKKKAVQVTLWLEGRNDLIKAQELTLEHLAEIHGGNRGR